MNIKNLKKYIPKRKYRERGQLEKRKKLGFLEKKQDYKIRADDYHKKEARYKKLKEEARTKNPEEFYFKMINSKTVDNEHMNVREEKSLEQRLSHHNKLINLVNLKKSLLNGEKEKLLTELQLEKAKLANGSTHKLFYDNVEDILNMDQVETEDKLLQNKKFRDEKREPSGDIKSKLNKLKEKTKNCETLNKISNTLSYQKHLIKPAKKKKVEGEENTYKFFNERKK